MVTHSDQNNDAKGEKQHEKLERRAAEEDFRAGLF